MCGIVGALDLVARRRMPEVLLERMRDQLAHRGPDGAGGLIGPGWALGHRRLSIIDLEGGAQPFVHGASALVANGEIYNHRELRQALSEHPFRSESDCEPILAAHRAWGDDAPTRLRGMFAYAYYDHSAGRLTLVRDRLGVKPLYWTRADGWLLFASEPKALLAHPGVGARLDREAVRSYLSFRYPLGDRTFYEGIHALEPGHRLVADARGVRVEQWWSIPKGTTEGALEDHVEAVREELARSVSLRLQSDVPLGAYLSGGVDSSAIVGLAARERGVGLRTYTIGFADEDYNEFRYAFEVAARHGALHTTMRADEGRYLEDMQRLIALKDAPLGVPNEVPLYQMSRRLKRDVTVVLSGEGADELFGGYGRIFRAADDFDRMRGGSARFAATFRARYGGARFETPADLFLARYRYFGADALTRWMDPGWLDSTVGAGERALRAAFDEARELPTARQFLRVFQRHHLPGLLQRLDSSTMAASVEGRVPFVDHELVELGQQLPVSVRMRWRSADARRAAEHLVSDDISEVLDTPKWVLKEAVRDLLPTTVLERRKMGFPVPLGRWLASDMGRFAKEVLLDPGTARRGLYRRDTIESALGGAEASWRDGMRVWMLLNVELFCRQMADARRTDLDDRAVPALRSHAPAPRPVLCNPEAA